MNNKIIGFTISRAPIDTTTVDVFDVGLTKRSWRHAGYHISIWGIGDLQQCFTASNQFSLSFPLTNSLLDRNVLVTLNDDGIDIENDWLSSIPVFYSTQQPAASTRINHIVGQLPDPRFDPEGFNDYLDFGYSVFEQTPVAGVKFLRYASMIKLTESSVSLIYKEDPALKPWNAEESGEGVIHILEEAVKERVNKTKGPVIIPSSGGFDSRLLNSIISESAKERIRDFTYGVSKDQTQSNEVINAELIARTLGLPWKRIAIGRFNRLTDAWFEVFGCSTHLHGMYQMEFYQQIRNQMGPDGTVASGIIGDVWSGNARIQPVTKLSQLPRIAYSHDMRYDSKHSRLKSAKRNQQAFFAQHREHLADERLRLVFAMRNKLMLLSYLLTVPEHLGYPAWTPFLNFEVVRAILSLPSSLRQKSRLWQVVYFKEKGLYVESIPGERNFDSDIDLEAMKIAPLENIKASILTPYIQPRSLLKVINEYGYLVKTGKRLSKIYDPSFKVLHWFRVRPLLARIGITLSYRNLAAVHTDLIVLKALESTVKKFFNV